MIFKIQEFDYKLVKRTFPERELAGTTPGLVPPHVSELSSNKRF